MRRNTLFSLFVESAQEAFHSPYIFIDWFVIFKVDPIKEKFEEYLQSQLHWIATHPLAFEEQWFKASVDIVNKFWSRERQMIYVDPLNLCREEILQLAREKDFFNSIIEKKLTDPDSDTNGFGFRTRLKGPLSGFIIYQIRNVNGFLRTVEFHIQYLLVNESAKGLGSQMIGCTLKVIENSFPGYTVIAFAESMPIDSTIHFWSKKLNFKVIRKNFVEGVYYPFYKLYPPSGLLETPDQLRL